MSDEEIDRVFASQHEERTAELAKAAGEAAIASDLKSVLDRVRRRQEKLLSQQRQAVPPVACCPTCYAELPPGQACSPCALEAVERRIRHFEATVWRRYRQAAATNREVVAWVEQLVHGAAVHESLLLTGGPGVGKTWEMFGAARAALERGWGGTIAWSSVAELLDELRPGGRRDSAGGLEDLVRVDLLLVDDLGRHKVSEWAEEQLGILVDRRWRDCASTIYTTNIPAVDQGEVLGDRIASRLAGTCRTVPIVGPDRRKALRAL